MDEAENFDPMKDIIPNRRMRRALGWTEPKVRKHMIQNGLMSACPAEQPRGKYSPLVMSHPEIAADLDVARHTPRLKGEPRRWQVQRARRRALKSFDYIKGPHHGPVA